jgi:hypothetical protein
MRLRKPLPERRGQTVRCHTAYLPDTGETYGIFIITEGFVIIKCPVNEGGKHGMAETQAQPHVQEIP